MAIPLTINGVTFQYPQQGDTNWGPTLTAWSTAVTGGMLQKAGGSFALTSEVDFGASFGMRVLYVKSEEVNIANTGFFRLANNSTGVGFRNSANSADLLLTVNTSNQLTFNGLPIGGLSALLDSHIFVGNSLNQPADVAMSGDVTINDTGVTLIGAGAITNAKVNATAAIALSKLASTSAYFWYASNSGGVLTPLGVTASRAVQTDANGLPSASSVTSTELGYVSGATSNLQAQINSLSALPAGMMVDFAGTVAPSGWVLCDGSSLLRASFSALFSAIGTTWGSADGTHFNVPNMTRRVGMGSGGSGTGTIGNAVGNTGGAETVTATQNAHTHTESLHSHTLGDGASQGLNSGTFANVYKNSTILSTTATAGGTPFNQALFTTGTQTDTSMTSTTATNNAASVIQPSAIVLKIIKT